MERMYPFPTVFFEVHFLGERMYPFPTTFFAVHALDHSKSKSAQGASAISSADELKKFKELLDMGVITQEEFDAKKKQLLGL